MPRPFAWLAALLVLGVAHAEEPCPVEVKMLLPPAASQPTIAALGLRGEAASTVYFFDTDSLDLLRQGVIIRIRQGAQNDLTVKLRPPTATAAADSAQLRAQFPCEIDRIKTADLMSYAVGHPYTEGTVPDIGAALYDLLDASQRRLLQTARASIDWSRVHHVVGISSTSWQTRRQSPYGKLSLELWQWSTGKILEISTKTPASDTTKFAELEQLLKTKGLTLDSDQNTKTTLALQSLVNHDTSRK